MEEWGYGSGDDTIWDYYDDKMKEEMDGIVAFRAGGSCLTSSRGDGSACPTTKWVEQKVLEGERQEAR